MVHASLRRIGPVAGGADGIIDALDLAVGERGTLVMLLGAEAGVVFDALASPASAEVGALAEVFRERQGTLVTTNPEGRFAARGFAAEEVVRDQPWDDYFGPGSPLEWLIERNGRVLRLGANDDTTTLMHYAEYLVPLPEKRRVTRAREVLIDGRVERRLVRCLDDENGIVDWDGEDYFALALRAYRAAGRTRRGPFGRAEAEVLEAADVVAFAVDWMSTHLSAT